MAALFAGAGWGAFGTGAEEAAAALTRAGAELTQLLRFMALLKATMALAALGGVWWRLGAVASPGWLLSYLAAGAAMAAGPGLIWGMAHVGLGALLLHGGLLVTLVLLWADPAVGRILGEALAARRRALPAR